MTGTKFPSFSGYSLKIIAFFPSSSISWLYNILNFLVKMPTFCPISPSPAQKRPGDGDRPRGAFRFLRISPPDRCQQGLPLIGQAALHHLVEEEVQPSADLRSPEAQGQQVPAVHRQLPQGEAGVLLKDGV